MNFVPRQHVPHVHHSLPCIRCIGAIWKTRQQLRKFRKGCLNMAHVPFGIVRGDKTREESRFNVVRGQSFHVIGVVDAGMPRVQTDKSIGGLIRSRKFVSAVMSVDEFQLRLLSVLTKRVPALQPL